MKYVCERVENIVGKGEIDVHQHFLIFPPCFLTMSSVQDMRAGGRWLDPRTWPYWIYDSRSYKTHSSLSPLFILSAVFIWENS